MKIIFDSDKEKENIAYAFSNVITCPSEIGVDVKCTDDLECCTCWKAALESIEKKEG